MITEPIILENVFSVFSLDKKGGALDITDQSIDSLAQNHQYLWIHLPREEVFSQPWINSHFNFSPVIMDSLFQDNSRPQAIHHQDEVLVNLRGLNFNPDERLEDMVSIRMWISPTTIVTTSKDPLRAVFDLKKSLFESGGPKNIGDIVTQLAKHIHDRINTIISELEDSTDLIEEDDSIDFKDGRDKLKHIKMSALKIRRYIVPQKEALEYLGKEKSSIFSDQNKLNLRQQASHITRFIENIDFIRDRTKIVHDELAIESSEKLNRNMYLLSIVAAVFLPLGFLTGLFGINVGGIPGTANDFAFYYFSASVLVIGIILFFVFKLRKWL